jgi:hypothetical protein
MGTLNSYVSAFETIGWFIPPYTIMSHHSNVIHSMKAKGNTFSQSDLENVLSKIYTPEKLSILISEKYPSTPFIKEYLQLLSNGIESHFLGLNHAAVCSILPVIEGVARKLAKHRKVHHKQIKNCIENVSASIKKEVVTKKLGAYGEIESMIDSFINFSKNNLYANSGKYPNSDKTNRHGILHGEYTDSDFGSKLNFYKAIGCINVLCFFSAVDAQQTWLLENHSLKSLKLYYYFKHIAAVRAAFMK